VNEEPVLFVGTSSQQTFRAETASDIPATVMSSNRYLMQPHRRRLNSLFRNPQNNHSHQAIFPSHRIPGRGLGTALSLRLAWECARVEVYGRAPGGESGRPDDHNRLCAPRDRRCVKVCACAGYHRMLPPCCARTKHSDSGYPGRRWRLTNGCGTGWEVIRRRRAGWECITAR